MKNYVDIFMIFILNYSSSEKEKPTKKFGLILAHCMYFVAMVDFFSQLIYPG